MRHINRVGDMGWQVRFDRKDEPYFSRYFSDGAHGGKRAAYRAAVDCLEQVQRRYRYTEQVILSSSDTNQLFWNRNELQAHVYLCTHENVRSLIIFHVGTINTVTDKRIREAHKKIKYIKRWADNIIETDGRDSLAGYNSAPEPYGYMRVIRVYK